MRSHLITNLFLLLLAIALGTFLFIDEVDKDVTKKLSNIATDSINQISIHHHQRDIVLSKSDQGWRLTKPVAISANQFRIKTLLNLLSTSSHAQYKADDLDLEKYGLAVANTQISFNDTKIDFGIVNPITNLRYVKIHNEVHLTDDNYYPLLSSQIGTLIASELLPAKSKTNKLVLPEHTLTRDENDLWQSVDDVSNDAIVETIYQWTHKQAFAVHDYIERESLGEIQVYLEASDSPVHFVITDIDPWLIIARPDIKLEYHFNLEDYDALLKPGTSKQLPDDLQNESTTETIQVSPDEFMNAIQSQ
ncbi:MAG: DUF4340 domain-containing protein [Gammaproteobacteria bacterium]|nr:DUF4340 domain-containing protein [Gammaproteobacteria bacterium]